MVEPKMKVVTMRIAPAHYAALREEATRRAVRGGGHADASAIVRELLDRWLEERAPKEKRSEKPKETTKRAK